MEWPQPQLGCDNLFGATLAIFRDSLPRVAAKRGNPGLSALAASR